MTSLGPNAADDQTLVEYLLGSLPEAEAEQWDELSVADDEFALRLCAVENDLTDAYARGELSGRTLERFQTFYLSTAKRREKVRFAESLFSFASRTAPRPARIGAAPVERASPEVAAVKSSWLSFLTIPRLGFAVAAAMLVVASLLVVDNVRLHHQVDQTQSDRATLEQRERELRAKLEQQHAANAEAVKELAQVQESLAQLEKKPQADPARSGGPFPVSIASFVLSPQMRGAGQMARVTVPRGTTRCSIRLELEADDFPQYRAALKDSATGQILWRSGPLKAASSGQNRTVSLSLPANLFRQRNYALELSGTASSAGAAELVSSYVFRVASE
jgi:hypothetical protein